MWCLQINFEIHVCEVFFFISIYIDRMSEVHRVITDGFELDVSRHQGESGAVAGRRAAASIRRLRRPHLHHPQAHQVPLCMQLHVTRHSVCS